MCDSLYAAPDSVAFWSTKSLAPEGAFVSRYDFAASFSLLLSLMCDIFKITISSYSFLSSGICAGLKLSVLRVVIGSDG